MSTISNTSIQPNTESGLRTIPKIIHYCWFGRGELPAEIEECINSWRILKDYKLIRWDESNCSFDENDFVKKAYSEKKYAFVSDYYRLKALYEYGGIYLDTDVIVKKELDPLLNNKVLLGFSYNCCIGTAIIGASKGSDLIASLLSMYDRTIFTDTKSDLQLVEKDGKFYISDYVTNNYYITWYALKNYPEFKLNNRYQELSDFTIYPKEFFEIGSLTGKHYTIHLNTGSWRTKAKESGSFKDKIKLFLSGHPQAFELVQIIIRKPRYYKKNKRIPFYRYSQAQKYHKELPDL